MEAAAPAALPDPYGARGVPGDADAARVRAAFRARARETHPDARRAQQRQPHGGEAAEAGAGSVGGGGRASGSNSGDREETGLDTDAFDAVRQAYEVLSDDARRREYDAALAAAARARRVAVTEHIDLDAMEQRQLADGEYEFSRSCRCGGRYAITEGELEALMESDSGGETGASAGASAFSAGTALVQCSTCSLVVSVAFSAAA